MLLAREVVWGWDNGVWLLVGSRGDGEIQWEKAEFSCFQEKFTRKSRRASHPSASSHYSAEPQGRGRAKQPPKEKALSFEPSRARVEPVIDLSPREPQRF